MRRAQFTGVAAAASFGLATVIIAAQAPAPPAGQAAKQPPPVQNPRPVPADPTQPQGQGRGGSPMQAARAAIKGAGSMTGTATLYEIANIHQNLDPMVPGPSGSGVSGGTAIACGVIER